MNEQPTSESGDAHRAGRRNAWILAVLLAGISFCLWLISREGASGTGPLIHYGLRVAMVVLCLMGWFRTQAMIGSRALRDGTITDSLHERTERAHRYFRDRPETANRVLIISSAFIDAFGIFLILYGILGESIRPFVALLILFMFRQICQAVCALPAPRDMIWQNPGFPSLLVTYSVGNDFFFSGHTAIAMLGAFELAQISPWLGAIGGIIALLEAFIVIALRAHYTIDVLGAIAATWCAVSLSNLLVATGL